mmetsp:Transcript_34929/g.108635  ORF Transcript_34929/g.108635 Transcript_34929/m.108635 type:complete len:304 (-) Transcript_34929:72-983(-)
MSPMKLPKVLAAAAVVACLTPRVAATRLRQHATAAAPAPSAPPAAFRSGARVNASEAPAARQATLLERGAAGRRQLPMLETMGPRPPEYFENIGPPARPASHESPSCHPRCSWSCGSVDCDEVCEPVCAPPQCETACSPINLATCSQKCDPPKCAIVCPAMHCEHGDCPKCKTVCGPPKCSTQCASMCESKCADPQCTWRCTPGQCEKPKCSLSCGGAKMCGLDGANAKPAPFGQGMFVLSKGLAAYDPAVLGANMPFPLISPLAGAPAFAPGPAGAPMAAVAQAPAAGAAAGGAAAPPPKTR